MIFEVFWGLVLFWGLLVVLLEFNIAIFMKKITAVGVGRSKRGLNGVGALSEGSFVRKKLACGFRSEELREEYLGITGRDFPGHKEINDAIVFLLTYPPQIRIEMAFRFMQKYAAPDVKSEAYAEAPKSLDELTEINRMYNEYFVAFHHFLGLRADEKSFDVGEKADVRFAPSDSEGCNRKKIGETIRHELSLIVHIQNQTLLEAAFSKYKDRLNDSNTTVAYYQSVKGRFEFASKFYELAFKIDPKRFYFTLPDCETLSLMLQNTGSSLKEEETLQYASERFFLPANKPERDKADYKHFSCDNFMFFSQYVRHHDFSLLALLEENETYRESVAKEVDEVLYYNAENYDVIDPIYIERLELASDIETDSQVVGIRKIYKKRHLCGHRKDEKSHNATLRKTFDMSRVKGKSPLCKERRILELELEYMTRSYPNNWGDNVDVFPDFDIENHMNNYFERVKEVLTAQIESDSDSDLESVSESSDIPVKIEPGDIQESKEKLLELFLVHSPDLFVAKILPHLNEKDRELILEKELSCVGLKLACERRHVPFGRVEGRDFLELNRKATYDVSDLSAVNTM